MTSALCLTSSACQKEARDSQSAPSGIKVTLPPGWRTAHPSDRNPALLAGPSGQVVVRVEPKAFRAGEPLPSPDALRETYAAALDSGLTLDVVAQDEGPTHALMWLRLREPGTHVVLGLVNTGPAQLGCSTDPVEASLAKAAYGLCQSLVGKTK
jgi:hypothetical protein